MSDVLDGQPKRKKFFIFSLIHGRAETTLLRWPFLTPCSFITHVLEGSGSGGALTSLYHDAAGLSASMSVYAHSGYGSLQFAVRSGTYIRLI